MADMDAEDGSGNNPPKDRWVDATGTILGKVGGACHLASIVLLSYPPQLGAGIRLKGVDLESLTDLQRQDNLYWTGGSYRVHGYIDDDYTLNAQRIVPAPSPAP